MAGKRGNPEDIVLASMKLDPASFYQLPSTHAARAVLD